MLVRWLWEDRQHYKDFFFCRKTSAYHAQEYACASEQQRKHYHTQGFCALNRKSVTYVRCATYIFSLLSLFSVMFYSLFCTTCREGKRFAVWFFNFSLCLFQAFLRGNKKTDNPATAADIIGLKRFALLREECHFPVSLCKIRYLDEYRVCISGIRY